MPFVDDAEDENHGHRLAQEISAIEIGEGEVQEHADKLKSPEVEVQTKALRRTVEALARDRCNVNAAMRLGIIPDIVKFLHGSTNAQQHIAAKAVMQITAGTEQQTNAIVESGAVPTLILLTRSQDTRLAQKALWSLGNIAGDNSTHHKTLKKYGAVSAILRSITKGALGPDELGTAVWALANVCRNKSTIGMEVVKECIPVLKSLLRGHDRRVIQDTCFTCAYLSEGTKRHGEIFVSSGIMGLLIPHLRNKDVGVVYPALRTISNLVSGSDEVTQGVVDSGVVQYLVDILIHCGDRHLVKEACWALSNITAGPLQQIQAVIDEGGFVVLSEIARHAAPEARSEAVWAIANALMGAAPQQVRDIATPEVLQLLCSILISHDSQAVLLALESIWSTLMSTRALNNLSSCSEIENFEDQDDDDFWWYANLVKEYRGLQRLAKLRMHDNDDISSKAMSILTLLVETPTAEFSDLDDDSSEETNSEEDDDNDGSEGHLVR